MRKLSNLGALAALFLGAAGAAATTPIGGTAVCGKGAPCTVQTLTTTSVTAPSVIAGPLTVDGALTATGGVTGPVTVTATGTTTARTLAARFAEVVNVKDFGALGDNSHDDLLPIRAAVTAVTATGGTVFFPTGIYKVSDEIVIAASHVTLAGSAMPSLDTTKGAWLKSTSTTKDIVRVGNGADIVGVSIEKLGFYGNDAGTGGSCIRFYTDTAHPIQSFALDGVAVQHCRDFGVSFETGKAVGDWGYIFGGTVRNLTAYANGHRGLRVLGNVLQVVFDRVLATDNGRGQVEIRGDFANGYRPSGLEFHNLVIGNSYGAIAWAPSVKAFPGERVTNDTGKTYECITAGTTAATGGPTGTGANITDGTAHWTNVAALLANDPAQGQPGLAIRDAESCGFYETWFEMVGGSDAYALQIASCMHLKFSGGKVTQAGTERGFLLATRAGAQPNRDITIDVPGGTNTSTHQAGEMEDGLAGGYQEQINFGRWAGTIMGPADVWHQASMFYSDKHRWLYEPEPADSTAIPGDATVAAIAGLSSVATGASAAVITNPYVVVKTTSPDGYNYQPKIAITPLDINAACAAYGYTAAQGAFTVTCSPGTVATSPWRFAWKIQP